MTDKIRLGGMALANGVLVHGPTAWACAVRRPDGVLQVASAPKRFRSAEVENPILRGPAKLAEVFLLLPEVRRSLPAARLPFEKPRVLTAMVASVGIAGLARGSRSLGPAARETVATLASLAPAALALRGGELAAYHGAEHISIGSYEHGEARAAGARALRLAPAGPAPGDAHDRERARRPRAGPPAQRGPQRGRRRRRRRVDGDLRLDGPAPRPQALEGAREARTRAAAPDRDG